MRLPQTIGGIFDRRLMGQKIGLVAGQRGLRADALASAKQPGGDLTAGELRAAFGQSVDGFADLINLPAYLPGSSTDLPMLLIVVIAFAGRAFCRATVVEAMAHRRPLDVIVQENPAKAAATP